MMTRVSRVHLRLRIGQLACRAGRYCLLGLLLLPYAAFGGSVTISPSKDNTLYEDIDGSLSNGVGEFLFTGMTGQPALRRAVISFNIAGSVPAGATINSATLTLRMSRTISPEQTVSLHRINKNWGEGPSDAPGPEGDGTAAMGGDATWIHTFWDTQFWSNSGGDFTPTASASTGVDQIGFYSWSSPAMAADVQEWLDDPGTNYGWILIGNEAEIATAKRFDSSENPTVSFRPTLTVEFTPATGPPGRVPNGDEIPGTPLTVQKTGGDDLALSWGVSCLLAGDTDYEIYQGALGSFTSHTPVVCSTGASTTQTITPAAGGRYYLVVPRSAIMEGSYGMDSNMLERPQSLSPCLAQLIGACP